MRWHWVAFVGSWFVVASSLDAAAQAWTVQSTQIIAPLAGRLATPAAGQEIARRFAPDLGLIDVHGGQLRIIFGDAIRLIDGDPISWVRDDVQGHISLADFPDGDTVDAYAAMHPAAPEEPSWWRQGPPITYRLTPLGRASTISLHDGGRFGRVLNTGLFKAPLAAFSNARTGDESGFFTIYARSVPLQCSGGDQPACEEGFECEPRLGKLFGALFEDGAVCMLGERYCRATPGGGLCVDPTSSLYHRELPAGLRQAVAWLHSVGNADRNVPERYFTRSWATNKFGNLTARTVNDFDPARAHGEGNDYRPTDGRNPAASKVFLWGRPGYVGTKADGRDLHVYFAVADLPVHSAAGEFAWEPRYFAGLSPSGEPQFSPVQGDAVPLDLGGSPRPESEAFDVVNQMSISWVEPLGSWVMLYGGGANPALVDLFSSDLGSMVEQDPEGAIRVRFARQPWGPWSAPQRLFAGGDPNPLGEAPPEQSQYAPGGILRHPMCTSTGCAPREPTQDPNDYGFLYAANVIDVWTEARPHGATLYWNVSTWHPYQVVLMRSEIAMEQERPPAMGTDAGSGGSQGGVRAVEGSVPLGAAGTPHAAAREEHTSGGDPDEVRTRRSNCAATATPGRAGQSVAWLLAFAGLLRRRRR